MNGFRCGEGVWFLDCGNKGASDKETELEVECCGVPVDSTTLLFVFFLIIPEEIRVLCP